MAHRGVISSPVLTILHFPSPEITAGQIPSWVSVGQRLLVVGGGPILSLVEKTIYDLTG